MSVLEVEDLVVAYGDGPPIVQGASVRVESGRTAVLLGPNGTGKSTLAKSIIGLLRTTSGRVYLDRRDVTGLEPYELVRIGIGYLPQLQNVFADLTVRENLEMGGITYKGDLRKRIAHVVELFPDLPRYYKKRASQLSGGEQRMVALGRVLMVDPKVIVMDEPTAGLSPLFATKVWQQIARIRDSGVALLVVEQNAATAIEHSDFAYVMLDGRIHLSGPAKEMALRKELAEVLVG